MSVFVFLADKETHHHAYLTLSGFIAREKELVLYDVLQSNPHPNIVRRLNTDQSDCLFLERVEPLKETWALARRTAVAGRAGS
ncbi:hypothetical protein CEP52_017766 [Fusarium oligoseptatum]|uniref:Uncharacterized protein n=1 Tax=Fusarium oligoseptatum TaxID=2604345 RepID=A0A428RGX3_9HYPO|nr:hypothetical protein CEP52_017766 [Fusarium oligoseptatum]